MKFDIEKLLNKVLEYYFNIAFETTVNNIHTREWIATIINIVIYSNNHNPPHFHVISKDKSNDAKFMIEDCKYLGGRIRTKDLKWIEAFHKDLKTQLLMKMIWNKRI